MNTCFYVRPSSNEIIQTTVHIKTDCRPAIIGNVQDENANPVSDALVSVYTSSNDASPDKLIDCAYTDEFGQFAIGPINPLDLYIVRIYKKSLNSRTIE